MTPHLLRGLGWVAIGAAAWGYSAYTGNQLNLIATNIPIGPLVIAIGVVLTGWDLWKYKKLKDKYRTRE
jgi:hypothetical protein